ncbi:MAG: 50S ribosomal protein L29 [Minisyncoccota bacterium]
MKAKEWREKSEGERERIMLDLHEKLRVLSFDLATREAKNHSEYRKLKKDIARLMTIKQEEVLSIPMTDEQ